MERLTLIGLFAIVFHLITINLVCCGHKSTANCTASERLALLDFKHGLKDPEDRLSSWSGDNCCQWRGIGCDSKTGAVIKVDLHNPHPIGPDDAPGYGFWNLSGEISPSLLKLKSLRHLDLSSNTFDGIPIPGFLGSLKSLEYLNLSEAGFGGAIPPFLGNLSRLQYLDISNNILVSSLTANSFQWVSGLVSLKHLEMNSVDLSSIELNWLEILNTLPHLTELHLQACSLPSLIGL